MSTMTAQATQVYSVFVRATPDQLWDAITKPEFTVKYFHGTVIDSTWKAGGKYCGFSADHSEQFVDGEVIEATPPSKLVTTWRAMWPRISHGSRTAASRGRSSPPATASPSSR